MWGKETACEIGSAELECGVPTSCVTQNKSPVLSGPQLPPQLNWDNTLPES